MDSIIEKARKILALVEQGVDGEVQAAKIALEALLRKHGLTVADLSNEKRERREFSIRSRAERLVFSHCLLNRFGRNSYVRSHSYTYRNDHRHVYADMTDIEYLDFKPFFEFHINRYRKELKKMQETVNVAYIHKNNLFDPNPDKGAETRGSNDVDMQELYRIMSVMNAMETARYHKELK